MADWVIWGLDRAANRVTGTQVTASHNASYAGRVADLDQATVWTPGSGATGAYIDFDLGSSYTLGAVGIGGHNMAGETIKVHTLDGFPSGSSLGVEQTKVLPATGGDAVISFTGAASQYWRVEVDSAITASQYIGTISLLDESYKYTMSYAPRYPIGREYVSGYAQVTGGGGAPYRQVVGGTAVNWTFLFDFLAAASGEVGDDIAEGLIEQSGWMTGIWITDDTFGDAVSNVGRGYYGISNGPVSIPISYPGARSQMRLDFLELPKGL